MNPRDRANEPVAGIRVLSATGTPFQPPPYVLFLTISGYSISTPLRLVMAVIARRSDLQHRANRLDSVLRTMLVNERVHRGVGYFAKRSSSATAKERAGLPENLLRALELSILALQLLEALALIRGDPRSLAAVSLSRAHNSRSVSPVQPILSTMKRIDAHCVGYASCWSSSSSTARSRSSGENGVLGFRPAPSNPRRSS